MDVLELGVPFSDPLADGLVNQLAAQRGLESGTTPPKVLETVAAIRKDSQIPVVLIYFNLIHQATGSSDLFEDAADAGVDGLLVLDLPPEESENYEAIMRKAGLCNIYLVAPTTPEERIEFIVKRGTGFHLLCFARRRDRHAAEGVGHHRRDDRENSRAHDNCQSRSGFGISNPEQARTVAQQARKPIVVGSAVVNQIAEHGKIAGTGRSEVSRL